VIRYQKGKTTLDFAEARDSEWQWHQLGHMQVCTLLQTDNHASTPPPTTDFFAGRMPFLPPNQPCQSTEGLIDSIGNVVKSVDWWAAVPAKFVTGEQNYTARLGDAVALDCLSDGDRPLSIAWSFNHANIDWQYNTR